MRDNTTNSRTPHFSGEESSQKIAYSEASLSEHTHIHIANKTMDETLTDILGAADRHPNSRVAKLIRLVEEQPSQKNIVILLIELSDHAEYATELNISLRYYLELFERSVINGDVILNEAGMLLLNSSKIYSKRVDFIHSLVEHQIMTLSNADKEIQENKISQQTEEKTPPPVKPRRGKKRALGSSTDPYEVQEKRKKIKKMTQEKRFSALVNKTLPKKKVHFRNIEIEQQCHPMVWKYATVYDLEDEEDFDTKRNYKMFSYHIEHRFNTQVADINFRLHYKVKDYLIAQEKEMDVDSSRNPFYQEVWPSNSEEYVRKYISLENRVLHQEINPTIPYVSPKRIKTTPNLTEQISLNEDDETITLETEIENIPTPKTGRERSSSSEESVQDVNRMLENLVADKNCSQDNSIVGINDSGMGGSDFETSFEINATQQENKTLAEDSTLQEENTIVSEDESLNTSYTTEGELDTSLNVPGTQIENDSALDESILEHSTNVITTELNMTTETGECRESILQDKRNTIENLIENAKEPDGKEPAEGFVLQQSDNIAPADCEKNNICSTEGNIVVGAINSLENIAANDSELDRADQANSPTCIFSENLPEAGENPKKEDQDGPNQEDDARSESKLTEGVQAPNTEELAKNLENAGGSQNVDCFDVEIEVLNDDGKAESNTIQIQIPNSSDDEGVHLSDAYENDIKSLSPKLKIPGVERKDVTIYMDEELREALEMHENMADHYFQETYTVPVIIEPKEQPLVLNILQLPPKLLKRKTLFKLGPEIDLYLKARLQKIGRTKEPPRTHRVLQSFHNNTDTNGILDTPPQSPGTASVFLGFTDDDETTCGDFCGFTEEEQIKLLSQRLSCDSGVGVDAASSLTSEKQPLSVVGEENATATSCCVDLDKTLIDPDNETEKKNTEEDLLQGLSTSLRTVLEAAIDESATIITGNSQSDEGDKENDSNIENAAKQVLSQPQIANEIQNDLEINSQSLNANDNENSNSPDHQVPQNGVLHLSDSSTEKTLEKELAESSDNNCPTVQGAIEREQQRDINSSVAQKACERDGPNTEDLVECTENCDNTNIEVNDDCENQPSPQDIEFGGVALEGTKTKIEKWHEHLRPILAKSKERHHFDVFHLGTEIIERLNSDENVKQKPPIATFEDVMQNKDKSYASRYFLSTLLLANQSNIGISVENRSSEMPSSWSDIQLKLLSTKRHTVAIEDNIGMINKKKRQATSPIEANISNKKKKTCENIRIDARTDDEEFNSAEEDCEPLGNLKANKRQFVKKENSISKKAKICATASVALVPERPCEMLVTSPIFLPPIDVISILPSTSKNAILPSHENPAVNLNQLRVLQPIQKLARQGDDLDSGIFSVDDMSSS